VDNCDAAIALSTSQSLHYQDADGDGVLVDTQSLECNDAVIAGGDFTSFINAKPTKLANNQALLNGGVYQHSGWPTQRYQGWLLTCF
jgi:hypothetical protein